MVPRRNRSDDDEAKNVGGARLDVTSQRNVASVPVVILRTQLEPRSTPWLAADILHCDRDAVGLPHDHGGWHRLAHECRVKFGRFWRVWRFRGLWRTSQS